MRICGPLTLPSAHATHKFVVQSFPRAGMQAPRGLLLFSICILSVSCGGSEPSTGTGGPTSHRLEVTPDSLLATAIGQTLAVTVTVDGTPASASFSLRSERRWLN